MTKKSGLADSPFWIVAQPPASSPLPTPPDREATDTSSPVSATPERDASKPQRKQKLEEKSVTPRNRDTVIPRHPDTMPPRYHDTTVEVVRKAVKEFGKEAATHRFTAEEKKAIADILYAYNAQGVKTSENQIARIAINFLVQDYRENGENSILDRVLKALNE
jgi:hypothetical protein